VFVQGDGGVIKKLLVAGEGWELPQKDDKVFGAMRHSPPDPAAARNASSTACERHNVEHRMGCRFHAYLDLELRHLVLPVKAKVAACTCPGFGKYVLASVCCSSRRDCSDPRRLLLAMSGKWLLEEWDL
jgi:hypothetical protein